MTPLAKPGQLALPHSMNLHTNIHPRALEQGSHPRDEDVGSAFAATMTVLGNVTPYRATHLVPLIGESTEEAERAQIRVRANGLSHRVLAGTSPSVLSQQPKPLGNPNPGAIRTGLRLPPLVARTRSRSASRALMRQARSTGLDGVDIAAAGGPLGASSRTAVDQPRLGAGPLRRRRLACGTLQH